MRSDQVASDALRFGHQRDDSVVGYRVPEGGVKHPFLMECLGQNNHGRDLAFAQHRQEMAVNRFYAVRLFQDAQPRDMNLLAGVGGTAEFQQLVPDCGDSAAGVSDFEPAGIVDRDGCFRIGVLCDVLGNRSPYSGTGQLPAQYSVDHSALSNSGDAGDEYIDFSEAGPCLGQLLGITLLR